MSRAQLVTILFLSGYLLIACGGGSSATQGSQLAVTSGTPPGGVVGAGYDGSRLNCRMGICECGGGFPLAASGGVAPYLWTWAAAAGSSLPKGLDVAGGNSICGIPTTAGSYNVVVTVSDSGSPRTQASANYPIVITAPRPVISTSPAPPTGGLNVPYAGFTFNATGGLLPLTWSETGALPPGMSLGMDGALSGTPTATGSFPIVVMVQDSAHQNANPQDFSIQIDAKLPSFTATGSMLTARASHTATLLSNGKVLVIGGLGDNGTTALASMEVFDPGTGQFTSSGLHLMTPRLDHTATLLKSGAILIVGGQDANGNAIAEAELFDPSASSFTTVGSMHSPRTGHTATLLVDGRVLIAGGIDSNKASLSTAELFNPGTGQFTLTNQPMTAIRAHHAATLLSNGKVLLVGGSSGTPQGDIFDPASSTFTSTTTGGSDNTFLTATLLADGRALETGGQDLIVFVNCNQNGMGSVAGATLFDSIAESFSATGDMSSSRAYHTASLLNDGKVLVAGGSKISTAENACVLTTTSTPLPNAELFNPTLGSFALTSSMTNARSRHTATVLANGDVLVIGGFDANNNPLASAELYR